MLVREPVRVRGVPDGHLLIPGVDDAHRAAARLHDRMVQQLVAVIHAEPVATLGGIVISLAILFSGVWR